MVFEIIGLLAVGGFGLWLTVSALGWWLVWHAVSGKHEVAPIVFLLCGIAILAAVWYWFPWDLSMTRKE